MNDQEKINDILDVVSGNKKIQVGIENSQIILFGLVLLFAVFGGVFIANKVFSLSNA